MNSMTYLSKSNHNMENPIFASWRKAYNLRSDRLILSGHDMEDDLNFWNNLYREDCNKWVYRSSNLKEQSISTIEADLLFGRFLKLECEKTMKKTTGEVRVYFDGIIKKITNTYEKLEIFKECDSLKREIEKAKEEIKFHVAESLKYSRENQKLKEELKAKDIQIQATRNQLKDTKWLEQLQSIGGKVSNQYFVKF